MDDAVIRLFVDGKLQMFDEVYIVPGVTFTYTFPASRRRMSTVQDGAAGCATLAEKRDFEASPWPSCPSPRPDGSVTAGWATERSALQDPAVSLSTADQQGVLKGPITRFIRKSTGCRRYYPDVKPWRLCEIPGVTSWEGRHNARRLVRS